MKYRLCIICATLIWGSSFVIVKDATTYLAPGWILAFRFALAALIIAGVSFKKRYLFFNRQHVAYGCLFGVALGLGYFFQTWGTVYTTPGKVAFLTGSYCVMVPFVALLIAKRRPTSFNLIAAVVCLAGIGLISLGNESAVNVGDGLTLVGAVFYAVHIVLVGTFSPGKDIYVLTMWQFAACTVVGIATGLASGTSPMQLVGLSGEQYGALLYLAVMCTAVALLLQNVGQAKLPAASSALLLSLESPFGVMFSVLLGADVLTGQILLGFTLVFAAIIISEWLPQKLRGSSS